MALDMRAWLKEMGVKEDAIDTVFPHFSDPAVVTRIEEGTLRQADYSRKSATLQAAQTQLDAANERLNQEMVDWAQTRDAGEPITEQMRTDLAKAKGEVERLKTVITTKATELGLDPTKVIGEAPPVDANATANRSAAPDLTGYVKVEDLNTRLSAAGRYLMRLPADVARIQHEHQALTGEWLDPAVIIDEVEARASDAANRNRDGSLKKPVDARAVWEEKFDIPTKRTAKTQADRQRDLDSAREEGRQEVRTQQALPGAEAPGRHAVVFRRPAGADGQPQTRTPKITRDTHVGQQDRISKAASALATHRYRGGTGPNAGATT
jgi:hypothetical protein